MRFEIFRDEQKQYRWRLKAGNNKIIASSAEAYHNKADCQHGIELVQTKAAEAKIEEIPDEG